MRGFHNGSLIVLFLSVSHLDSGQQKGVSDDLMLHESWELMARPTQARSMPRYLYLWSESCHILPDIWGLAFTTPGHNNTTVRSHYETQVKEGNALNPTHILSHHFRLENLNPKDILYTYQTSTAKFLWAAQTNKGIACKLRKLHASLCNCMQAYVTACKPM